MLRALFIVMLAVLGGCALNPPLPAETPALTLPVQALVHKHTTAGQEDAILVVQAEPAGVRWSLLDPLGMPLARLILQNGQWQADGLAPPNADARELFAALLFAWTPGASLERLYPSSSWHVDIRSGGRDLKRSDGQLVWQVDRTSSPAMTITNDRGVIWSVKPMPGATP